MMFNRYVLLLLVLLLIIGGVWQVSAKEIRIWGGKTDEFTDSQGRVWFPAQKAYDAADWGGWVEKLPQVAEVRTLTDAAKKKAADAGYDEELFYAVSWAAFPDTVKIDVNTGNGVFNVTYLVGEHWSPSNRGFDILIEDENVLPLYVTPGQNEIDIKEFKGIKVNDGVMNFHFAGNAETGAGDLNATVSGLEITPDPNTAVELGAKLTTTWADLKSQ